ncbi:hypothetical protein V1515DRAFT_623077 [Lipomyces mesembrius]
MILKHGRLLTSCGLSFLVVPLVIWPTKSAPEYKGGTHICLSSYPPLYLEKRNLKRGNDFKEIWLEDAEASGTGEKTEDVDGASLEGSKEEMVTDDEKDEKERAGVVVSSM